MDDDSLERDPLLDEDPMDDPEDVRAETDADLFDLLWHRSGLATPPDCLAVEYLEVGNEQDVLLLPSWWEAQRPADRIARLELVDLLLLFDPADGWLIPAIATTTGSHDRLAELLGASSVRGLQARMSPVVIDPGDELMVLSRLAVGTWLYEWATSGRDALDPDLLAVEVAALAWHARSWLPPGTAQAWLVGRDAVVDALLTAAPGSSRHVVGALADQARRAGITAGASPEPPRGERSDYLDEVLRCRQAVSDDPQADDFDPDRPFLAQL